MKKISLAFLAVVFGIAPLFAQPTITTPPTNQVLALGATLTMSVTASGTAPLAYQWFKDNRWLLGATNSTLTVANAGVTNSGSYFVVLTNGDGMVISLPASVAVGNPSLLAWGYNGYGQLGNGMTIDAQTVPIAVASNVVAGAVGAYHSLFMTTDGTLWAMGWNRYGQLGNGTYVDTNKPISVASNVVAVAAGFAHTLWITSDGNLWAVGWDEGGQLGNGADFFTSFFYTNQPNLVASNVVTVAAGQSHSLFITRDGTLWAMGNNGNGELGNGTYVNTNRPVNVASNVVAIAAGAVHSMFITTDGTLWAMGWNNEGEFGNGTGNGSGTPLSVASNLVAVAAGYEHSLLIKTNAILLGTGSNGSGQLGNGTTINTNWPIVMASNVVEMAAGAEHSLFVNQDGKLWATGINDFGQLGDGTQSDEHTPVNVPNIRVANVFSGKEANHSLALGIFQAVATVTLDNLNQTYTGNGLNATANTTPPGLTVNLTYNGSTTAPTNTGSYSVIGTVNDFYFYGSVTNTMVVGNAPATVTVANLNQTYTGSAITATASTIPTNLTVSLTYNGTSIMPTNAGNYTVIGNIIDQNYYGFATNTLVIKPASAIVTLSNLNQTYVGNAINATASTIPPGLAVNLTYNGSSVAPTNVGTYTVIGMVNDPNGFGSTTNILIISPASATLTLGNLNQAYTGSAINVTASTVPPGLAVNLTYNGFPVAPTNLGSYTVIATINDPNGYGGATNTLVIRQGAAIVTLTNLTQTYTGGAISVTSSTSPPGLTVNLTYNGSPVSPTNVGNYIVVGTVIDQNYFGSATNKLAIIPPFPPTITSAPTNQLILLGGNVMLSVTASGMALTYQWFKDSRSLFGATNATLALANAGATNSGTYFVVVANGKGMVISLPVLVAVGDPSLLAWGNNSFGQLGNGITISTNQPVRIVGNVVAGAAGNGHSLFVTSDGTLWGMGENNYGQLGNGTTNGTKLPVIVASNVVAVAAGQYHSLFVTSDGTLWAMGYNNFGQLGNGTTNNASLPVSVASNAVVVAAGQYHSLFVANDGTLWAMGYNNFGQLGSGTNNNASQPVSIASNVVAASAGQDHSLFVKTDGTLWAMGHNQYGQLGNGKISNANQPVNVASNVVAMATGQYHSLYIKANGVLWAMGYNNFGQLGNGTYNNTSLPVSVASNVVAVAAGYEHSLLLKTNGALWASGYNAYGQLGNGTTSYTNKFVSVAHVSAANIFQVAMANHSLALGVTWLPLITAQPTNQVLAVGATVTLGVTLESFLTPTYQWFKDGRRLLGATNGVLTIASAETTNSGTYYLVVTNGSGMVLSLPATVAVGNPTLLAWGNNQHGQLGNGTTNNANLPLTVASNVVTGAAGQYHSLFVTTDGTLWAMGWNYYGQLGNGIASDFHTPVSVASNVVSVAAGYNNSFFVTADGNLWAMGDNSYGQLGNGTTIGTGLPIKVASSVVMVVAGWIHSLFVTTDGTLWAMGSNGWGELGDGTTTDRHRPIPVAKNVVAVAAGSYHSLFMKTDGTLWAMGSNFYGELGTLLNYENINSPYVSPPTSVASNVVAVAAGEHHSLFVDANGILWATGFNTYGQLGNGRSAVSIVPWASVASNVTAVTAGESHSQFVKFDGTFWTMGYNAYGQLGNGTMNDTNLPVNVPHLSLGNILTGDQAYHSLALGINYNAVVALSNLNQLYTGSAINVAASTMPSGLAVHLTYNGSSSAPTNSGSYTVIGTISDPNYYGSATNTLVVGLPPQSFTASNTNGVNGQQLNLQLTGTPAYPYILQTATNLTPPINWQSIFTNPADVNGNWSFTVTNLTALPGSFYRAVGQ